MNETVDIIRDKLGVEGNDATKIFKKAVDGGEIQNPDDNIVVKDWLENRFLKNCVFIDEQEYAVMCINALKIVRKTAPTDYGSSRQRDLGQLWADMTRGYLGEIAFSKFLKERWQIDTELGHEPGPLADYLPMDIHKVKKCGEEPRDPKVRIGVKTTKWNGIWFDIPGNQFDHSDIHVMVKIGTGRDHLFAFFKEISVFRDKILKKGIEVGSLSESESKEIFESLPSFRRIPAYVCGFVKKSSSFQEEKYDGRKGRIHYTITAWRGRITNSDIERIRREHNVVGKIKFLGIGKFSHDGGYLFNSGSLQWQDSEWQKVCASL